MAVGGVLVDILAVTYGGALFRSKERRLMTATTLALATIAVTIPFIVSIIVALKPEVRPLTHHDYFLYGRRVTPAGFVKTTVGYSLQVAAVFLFFQWTFSYGAVAFFIPITWGAGYFALAWAVSRGVFDLFLRRPPEETVTIHGFVGEHIAGESRRRHVVRLLACTTIAGLAGTLMVELDYVALFLIALMGLEAVPGVRYVIEVGMLSFTGLYVLWGGFKAVVETDKTQVPLSYAALLLAFWFLIWDLIGEGQAAEGALAGVAVLLLMCSILLAREWVRRIDPSYEYAADRFTLIVLLVLGLLTVLYAAMQEGRFAPISGFFLPSKGLFLGFGLIGVVSLTLANVMWQFLDLSSLQRLQSVDLRDSDSEEQGAGEDDSVFEEKRNKLVRAIRAAGVEACAGWLLLIVIASVVLWHSTLLTMTGNVTEDLAEYLATHVRYSQVVIPLFVFAVVTFMLSTLDGLISAIAYVTYYDLPRSRKGDLSSARRITMTSLGLVYLGYLFVRNFMLGENAEQEIYAVLYAFYAVQLAVGLIVLLVLFKPAWFHPYASAAAIVAAWVAAFGSVMTDPPPWIPLDSWYVIPPLLAFLAAGIVYVVTIYPMRWMFPSPAQGG